jgi:tetratricopeptide (TPR) repeat protein
MKLLLLLIALTPLSFASHPPGDIRAPSAPCTDSERWVLAPGLAKTNPRGPGPAQVRDFSRALHLEALSRISPSAKFEEEFSRYWIARSLYSMGLELFAEDAFRAVLLQRPSPAIREAAEDCLARIARMHAPRSTDANAWEPILRNIETQNHRAAIEGLQNLSSNSSSNSSSDEAHLLLGRTYYSVGRFRDAAREFQKVDKTSNLAIEALENLAWAYLLAGENNDAIGIGLQPSSGPLRATFAPEGMLVSAMALHELCQYPEALRMIGRLINDYAPVRDWLQDRSRAEGGYRQTLDALRRTSRAPRKLQTEWIRSPSFLISQDRINRNLAELPVMNRVAQVMSEEKKRMVRELTRDTTLLIESHTKVHKSGKKLPQDLVTRYLELKRGFRRLRELDRSSVVWERWSRFRAKEIPLRNRALAAQVDADFKVSMRRLEKQLAAVFRNAEWVEIEALNGASKDLVWREAHPEYLPALKRLQSPKAEQDPSLTWSWGKIRPQAGIAGELWEDELGALKANVRPHCDLKKKYMKEQNRSTE